mmetsp:Transcript_16005/g.15368  ORF Transcript_16005/g.15368 Transcript_16005/m.15368 type:complete len:320 (-) Transcript_16005:178-1137(-)|eukprot:CAMPEP_0119043198 /NCGR_PEP_ID=MMETSP1177-20130426/19006_1 /TAXON_ID=2985 /ORGANISM="Ochromonas sp, Strain CCMP1899" /LENGTH=319 /DNA_ID=CAMNT_0007010781 /DNA_START=128 /DNA_END=1090 /DNA_ORIENTATION=-
MNVIIFLAVSAIFSVQVTAENSHENLHMRGTNMDNAGRTKPVRTITDTISTFGKHYVLSAESSSGVLTSHLASGYFSISVYTDATCSNNNLAYVQSFLLDTCSLSSDGKYTKTLGYAYSSNNTVVTSAYTDEKCSDQFGATNMKVLPNTCETNVANDDDDFFSTVSVGSSFTPKLTYPAGNTGIISQNYGTEGCAGAPILESYYRSRICLDGREFTDKHTKDSFAAPTVTCSASGTKISDGLFDCQQEGEFSVTTELSPLATCVNEPEYYSQVNTEGVNLGSFSSVSCQQAVSGANSKRGVMDVLLGAIAGSAVLFLLF